jgi:hypothetical protein
MKELFIVEGVAGLYHYHLSLNGDNMKPALCGNTRVMHTGCKLSTWGLIGHLNEKYCKECEEIAVGIPNIPFSKRLEVQSKNVRAQDNPELEPLNKEKKKSMNIHEKLKASVFALKAIQRNLEPVLKDLEMAEFEGLGIAPIKTQDPGLCISCRKSKICSAHKNSKILAIKCGKYGERKSG